MVPPTTCDLCVPPAELLAGALVFVAVPVWWVAPNFAGWHQISPFGGWHQISPYFAKRPSDGLEGHELWQSANTSKYGIGGRKGAVGGRNPAIALSTRDHRIVNGIQSDLITNPRSMTPLENIRANLTVLRRAQRAGVDITDTQINEIGRQAVRFYLRLMREGVIKL